MQSAAATTATFIISPFIFTFIHIFPTHFSFFFLFLYYVLLMTMANPMQFCMDTTSEWLKGLIPDETVGNGTTSPSDELLPCPLRPSGPPMLERRLRPPHDHALKCPRCDSAHTKFCYYNNYSLSQPRYFCKTCRRYWTKGGSLRNVPVGGGCRKNKRPASSKKPAAAAASSAMVHHHHQPPSTNLNFMFDGATMGHFGGSGFDIGFDIGSGFDIGLEEANAAADVKPGNRMLSLEWPDQGCGGSDTFGYASGIGMWVGMINGHGPSSAAM